MFEILGEKSWLPEKLQTAEKTWFWTCIDMSEGKPKREKFAARFKTVEDYENFHKEFLQAHEVNTKLALEKLKKNSESNKCQETEKKQKSLHCKCEDCKCENCECKEGDYDQKKCTNEVCSSKQSEKQECSKKESENTECKATDLKNTESSKTECDSEATKNEKCCDHK